MRTHQMPKITRPSIATNAILERKVRKWEISPTCDSRPPQLIINIRRPFHASKSNHNSRSCINLCIPENPCYAHADVSLHSHAWPSGPFNVFDPWSKLFYKYIHVRRVWPSLGQVHSEFGSELEQPLAARLHWTKGQNMSDKLSKKKNTQKSQN